MTTLPFITRQCFDQIDGVGVHWAEVGESVGAAPPLLLLHGLNDSHLTWRRVAPQLARDRRVVMPDLPGHGLSDRPDASYTLAWYARIVARLVASLELDRFDVVGHSLGGGIAQMMLRECRPRIRRMVLSASGGLGKEIGLSLRLASIPFVVERFGQPFMGMGTRLALRPSREGLSRADIVDLARLNARRGTARAFARTVRDLIDWRGQRQSFLAAASAFADLPPIAVVWGDRDAVIPIAHGKALRDAVDGVVFKELPGCGHFVHHDAPAAFVQAVRAVLDARTWPATRGRAAAG